MGLTPKQTDFLEALLVSRTIREAIEKTGISSSTAYKYLNENEEFQEVLRNRKNETLTHISTRLNNLGIEALNTLEELIHDETGEVTSASKVTASRVILEYMYRANESEELERRIDNIERLLDEAEKERE